ncbi:MAG TPA: M14 family zinc carboxypeptidase [Xanthomonadales bacterium]|nr:M14 family zinc carboxypeptidase [Xanthomonadales bacterium]
MTAIRYFTLAICLTITGTGLAAPRNASEYLPADADPDPAIPTPESVLGWNVGDWHVSHDKLMTYMHELAESSERVSLKVTGYSHEQRPTVLLTITSADNADRVDSMRQAHINGDPDAPLVVWLGYSVHGDEPSGSNAAMLVAYYLAAARSDAVTEILDGSIILIDPSLNPDGLNRNASWINSNAGKVPVADPARRQYVQGWPEGRTNHYLFDLNRDWLPLVHPESRARMAEFQQWRPHVLTDHHEQGGHPGFFFQPGVPSRQNPLTPQGNIELTRALAVFHAEALENIGQPIFMEEAYDDFYFGKGSTYPDINGSIGILFEQRAIGGQALATSNGIETFQMAVANQFRVSLSTLQGSWELRDRLKNYQRAFYRDKLSAAERIGFTGWVVGDDNDHARAQAFLDLLSMHDIEYEAISEPVRAGDLVFEPGGAWFIPARQRQFGLLQAMMEMRTSFQDETFYDVSAWTMPLAYNLPFATVRQAPGTDVPTLSSSGLPPAEDAAGWLIPWNQLGAAELLQALLQEGARVRTAIKPFSVQTSAGLAGFESGTLLIQPNTQDESVLPVVNATLLDASLSGLAIHSATQTITAVGPDFGSENFKPVRPVNPLLVGGEGIGEYDFGEAWFALDFRVGVATPIVEKERLASVSLSDYSHIILPNGSYDDADPALLESISQWALDGGIVIAIGGGATWVEGMCFEDDPEVCATQVETENQGEPESELTGSRPYGSLDDDRARLAIGGAIVGTVLDTSHPLAFGFPRNVLPIMRRGTTILKPSENPYSTPVRYSETPLLAGYVSDERLEEFSSGPAVIAEKRGDGLVVRFANTPLFRGFWRGSERLFFNALFFGQAVDASELPN